MHFMSTTSLYDPSTLGAITTINYSVDQKLFGGSVGDAEIALKQNGKVYFGFPEVNQFNGSWTTFTLTGLNSSSFALLTSSINSSGELIFDSAQNPDFSSSGAPILFGLGTTFNTLSNPFSGQWGVDNWT